MAGSQCAGIPGRRSNLMGSQSNSVAISPKSPENSQSSPFQEKQPMFVIVNLDQQFYFKLKFETSQNMSNASYQPSSNVSYTQRIQESVRKEFNNISLQDGRFGNENTSNKNRCL